MGDIDVSVIAACLPAAQGTHARLAALPATPAVGLRAPIPATSAVAAALAAHHDEGQVAGLGVLGEAVHEAAGWLGVEEAHGQAQQAAEQVVVEVPGCPDAAQCHDYRKDSLLRYSSHNHCLYHALYAPEFGLYRRGQLAPACIRSDAAMQVLVMKLL